jgi:YD repeat-containing protein
VDGESGPGVRLAEESYAYDEANRLILRDRAFFDARTGVPVGDGIARARVYYNANSTVRRTEDDNGHFTDIFYDHSDRLREVKDALSNLTDYEYDANSNVASVMETGVGVPPGAGSCCFTTTYTYDSLDRRTSVTRHRRSVSFLTTRAANC